MVLVITTTTMGNSFSVLSFAPVGDKSADAESVLIWNKVASRELGKIFPNEKDSVIRSLKLVCQEYGQGFISNKTLLKG
ncbi:MAG TPA: hypothetical protein VJ799_03220 [Nitrososphaeraceae archaeon]|nr:hypothetical protein [Nitrososphaeraceae archaeon]